MHIALIAESFDAATGGAARVASALSEALRARGHEVAPLAPSPGLGRLSRSRALWRLGEEARAAHAVTVSLGRAPADVFVPQGGVHLAGLVASVASERAPWRAPSTLGKLVNPGQWALLYSEARAFAEARVVVALSRRTRGDMAHFMGIDPARVAVVPNGAPVERLRPPGRDARAAARAALGVEEGALALAFVSHNWRLRGLDPLLAALADGPAEQRARRVLLVVGRGPRARYEALAAQLGVRAHFPGALDDPQIAYHAADALVHPTFYDPCSLVTLEALAAGLPVLTTRANGASELFAGPEGIVLGAPTRAAIADGLARLEDAAARRLMGAAARASAERETAARALARLATLIEATAAARAPLGTEEEGLP